MLHVVPSTHKLPTRCHSSHLDHVSFGQSKCLRNLPDRGSSWHHCLTWPCCCGSCPHWVTKARLPVAAAFHRKPAHSKETKYRFFHLIAHTKKWVSPNFKNRLPWQPVVAVHNQSKLRPICVHPKKSVWFYRNRDLCITLCPTKVYQRSQQSAFWIIRAEYHWEKEACFPNNFRQTKVLELKVWRQSVTHRLHKWTSGNLAFSHHFLLAARQRVKPNAKTLTHSPLECQADTNQWADDSRCECGNVKAFSQALQWSRSLYNKQNRIPWRRFRRAWRPWRSRRWRQWARTPPSPPPLSTSYHCPGGPPWKQNHTHNQKQLPMEKMHCQCCLS